MPRTFAVFLFLLLLIVHNAIGEPLSIRHIGIDQGLSNNSVRCIYQDHNGFMWFGTYDGLNRYDGYQFKVFRNKLDDSSSLPHNYIYTISEDQHHRLWVGTGQGTAVYNNRTGTFCPTYFKRYTTGKKQKVTVNVTRLVADSKGNMLIGTNGQGLLIQADKAEVAVQIPYETSTGKSTDYYVSAILADEKQQLWLFINDVGICRYDYNTGKIKLVSNAIKYAGDMTGNSNGIWLGGVELYFFNPHSATIETTYGEANKKLTSNNISTLLLDTKSNLWIGAEGSGIDILNTATNRLNYLPPGPNEQSLSSEPPVAIYEDNQHRKWIGTRKGGINIIDPWKKPFQSYQHQPLNLNSLIYDFTSCFYEAADKNLWIGTDGGGLSIWDRQQGRFTNFRYEPEQAGSLSNNRVSSIRQDYEGNIWLTTFGGGVNRYNKATGTFQHYQCINPESGVNNSYAWLVYEDQEKTLWVTTFSQGKLYRYNRPADRFELFAPDLTDLISLTEDAAGNLWGGNAHQLAKINKQGGKNTIHEIGKPIRAIYEDKRKNLWLGTEGGGLIRFDRQTGKIVARYATSNGLCNNSVLNILEDKEGNLWLSTFDGLSKFDPVTQSFKNFYQADGLQSNQFSYNAALRLQSGELVVGGIKGFSIFNPDSLQFASTSHPLRVTRLLINGEPVADNQDYITDTSSGLVAALRIPYDQAVLTVDFAALEYSVPGKIAYAYYLEGWDKNWNYTGNNRTASYTRLREGTYTLRIKATNSQGDWEPEQTLLTVVVMPPWYRTWWAYLMYAGFIAVLIYFYNSYRVRQAKLEYEVKLARMNAEKEKELNEKKLSFFTDISHEFRTPLTLIINPLKDFMSSGKKTDSGELNMVYRNAARLLRLVDQLLQFQKAGSGTNQLKVVRTDFKELCREVYESFEAQAQRKKLDYRFEYTGENFDVYTDREKMEIVFFNLLSNALKYTPEGGRVVFALREMESAVTISLSDTGPGIPEGVGDKLFERFYQVKESRSPSKPGFGIGLYLVKHFVELHKGNISYNSQLGSGTTFNLQLLKGTAHFDAQTIIETEPVVKPPEHIAEPKQEVVAVFAQPKKEKPAEPEEIFSGKQSILIVEDHADIRQYILSIFQQQYNVYEAADGETGIRLAKDYLPDLIISDVMMPNGTGIDLTTAIKQDATLSHIPIILLTAAAASDMKLKGLESGADDYITKPFDKELLLARVVNLLKRRTTLQNYFYNEVTLQQNNLKVSSEYKEFLDRCIAIVEAHLDDEQFSIKTLAKEIGMSHSNLYKKVKSISGQSINAFIRFIRLRKAAELLIHTDKNVNETAFEVGINDIKYFREQFNKLFGMNPSEYIKKYRKAFGSSVRVNKDAFGE